MVVCQERVTSDEIKRREECDQHRDRIIRKRGETPSLFLLFTFAKTSCGDCKLPRMLHEKSTALGYRRSAFSSKWLIQRFRKGLPLFSFSGLGLDICICIEAIHVEKGYGMGE